MSYPEHWLEEDIRSCERRIRSWIVATKCNSGDARLFFEDELRTDKQTLKELKRKRYHKHGA